MAILNFVLVFSGLEDDLENVFTVAVFYSGLESSEDSFVTSPWHKKLKQAQYNLFCKELFSQVHIFSAGM